MFTPRGRVYRRALFTLDPRPQTYAKLSCSCLEDGTVLKAEVVIDIVGR